MSLTEVDLEVQGKIKRISIILLIAFGVITGCSGREKQAFEEGKAFLDAGQYIEAVESFDKAIGIHGSRNIRGLEIDILRYRGEAEYLAGEYRAAEHTYKLLISADEERMEYLDMLAMIYAGLSNTDMDVGIDDAIEMYEKAAGLGDGSELHINAGLAISEYYEDMYDRTMEVSYLDTSEEMLEELLEDSNRKNAKVLAVYAGHLSKREDYTGALTTVEEGIALLSDKALNENDTITLKSLEFSRAVCYEYLTDYEKAIEYFEAYTDKYGESAEAAHEVEFLKSRLR